jgi:hypothetical protein
MNSNQRTPAYELNEHPVTQRKNTRPCASRAGSLRQCVALEPHQIGDEQEQPARPCGELARAEHEVADIGDGLRIGTDPDGTLVVEPARQVRKALGGERDKIEFLKLNIANLEPLPIGPTTVIGDNVTA